MAFRPRLTIAVTLALIPTLGGCGYASGGLVSPPVKEPASQRLTALTALDQRVARVAQRLSDANVDLCPVVRNSAGWALHAANLYSLELRPLAEARFGLDGDLPGILAAPDASAATTAGLRQGDLITAVNGEPLAVGPVRGEPVFDGFAANVRRLDTALAAGAATLTIRRDGAAREIAIQPRRSCGYDVQLNPSGELNARADGRRLFISTALAGFTQTDDELAVILGHELAHHVLGHRTWSETGGGGRTENADRNELDAVGGAPERQADRIGLYLAARAGFDTRVAPAFWRRFGASNWRVRYPQLSHDSAGARAEALEAVQAEIEARRVAGEALIP